MRHSDDEEEEEEGEDDSQEKSQKAGADLQKEVLSLVGELDIKDLSHLEEVLERAVELQLVEERRQKTLQTNLDKALKTQKQNVSESETLVSRVKNGTFCHICETQLGVLSFLQGWPKWCMECHHLTCERCMMKGEHNNADWWFERLCRDCYTEKATVANKAILAFRRTNRSQLNLRIDIHVLRARLREEKHEQEGGKKPNKPQQAVVPTGSIKSKPSKKKERTSTSGFSHPPLPPLPPSVSEDESAEKEIKVSDSTDHLVQDNIDGKEIPNLPNGTLEDGTILDDRPVGKDELESEPEPEPEPPKPVFISRDPNSQIGTFKLSLAYVVVQDVKPELRVHVDSASDLKCPQSYVKLYLHKLSDLKPKRKNKTEVVKCAKYDHEFAYQITLEDLKKACLEIEVWSHSQFSNKYVGGLRLNLGSDSDCGITEDEMKMWKRMTETENEWVEETLPLYRDIARKCSAPPSTSTSIRSKRDLAERSSSAAPNDYSENGSVEQNSSQSSSKPCLSMSIAYVEDKKELRVHIEKAEYLEKITKVEVSFVKVSLRKAEKNLGPKTNTSPTKYTKPYDREFWYTVEKEDLEECCLHVEVYKFNQFSRAKLLGSVQLGSSVQLESAQKMWKDMLVKSLPNWIEGRLELQRQIT